MGILQQAARRKKGRRMGEPEVVSRAEFRKRAQLLALLENLDQADAVVVRDETRLGGDTFRTGMVIQDILDAGVRLFYYYSHREVTLRDASEKFLMAAQSFASESEREKIAQRTHEHLLYKARHGFVAGGCVYGYRNVPVFGEGPDGRPRRLGVKLEVHPEEAEVVRRIFRLYADGMGVRHIGKLLNEEGVPPPRDGARGWSSSCIWEMLRREKYRGLLVWNRLKKTYRRGTKVRVKRPEEELVRVDAPHLAIVEEALW